MEENVSAIIKLISEDGDSFAKRAEMYYERRPELLDFVEESYRIYRALAERYDHISTELQNANNTLSSAFPERFQFAVNDDDKYGSPQKHKHTQAQTQSHVQMQTQTLSQPQPLPQPQPQLQTQTLKRRKGCPNRKTSILGDPNQLPTNNIKSIIALTAKTNSTSQPPPKKAGRRKGSKAIDALRSGLKKAQAFEEMEKLQNSVLNDDEFMGSSGGKTGVAKLSTLQDEFITRKTIDDDEGRNLMHEVVAKSYHLGLIELCEKHPKLSTNANQVRQRIKIYNGDNQSEQPSEKESKIYDQPSSRINQVTTTSQEKKTEILNGGKMKERFPSEGDSSTSVSGMVQKIDELATKVNSLEYVVFSQIAIIPRLREEKSELQTQIQSLENEKENLIDGNNILNHNLKEVEHKLKGLQELDHTSETRNGNFEGFAEESSSSSSSTSCSNNLELILQSQKLSDIRPNEEIGENEPKMEETATVEGNETPSLPRQEKPKILPLKIIDSGVTLIEDDEPYIEIQQKDHDKSNERMFPSMEMGNDISTIKKGEDASYSKQYDNPVDDSQASRSENQVKTLEKVDDNSEDSLEELIELMNENASKDEEIQSLQQQLILLQQKLEDQFKNVNEPAKEDNTNNGKKDEYIIKLMLDVDEQTIVSPVEAKLRASIDEILEENLDFWMRLSSSLCETHKFQSRVENLQKEAAIMEEEDEEKVEDAREIIYNDLKEIETHLIEWSMKSMALKEELQCRFPQLCRVQEDITKALNDEAIDDEMQFTSLHAAKLQGEVLNMKQENNRVAAKLQASLDDITSLQHQVERIISTLNRGEMGKTKSSKGSGQLGWKNQAPLRSFISKLKLKKKQKESIFSDVHPTFHIKYQPLTY